MSEKLKVIVEASPVRAQLSGHASGSSFANDLRWSLSVTMNDGMLAVIDTLISADELRIFALDAVLFTALEKALARDSE